MKMSSGLLSIVTHLILITIAVALVLLFVFLGVLVLIHVSIVGRAFSRGLSTMNRATDGCGAAGDGLSPDDLDRLPCYEFRSGGPADCVVCLESFRTGEKCRILPLCKHSFHAHCVDSWLVKSPVCPICRTTADCRKAVVVGFPVGVVTSS